MCKLSIGRKIDSQVAIDLIELCEELKKLQLSDGGCGVMTMNWRGVAKTCHSTVQCFISFAAYVMGEAADLTETDDGRRAGTIEVLESVWKD